MLQLEPDDAPVVSTGVDEEQSRHETFKSHAAEANPVTPLGRVRAWGVGSDRPVAKLIGLGRTV
jgi:hypothetical protein